jgi:hypothetical protein
MNGLKVIEDVNEEIKNIVSAAEDISLTANNAMLEIRRGGINAVGFSLVARELQMFSEKMVIAMHSLSGLIYWQVDVNVGKHHWEQNRDFLSQAPIAQVCACRQPDEDETEQLIVSQVCELQIRMMRTAKLCATGLLIARSVDMDAPPDGTMTVELHRITQDVEKVVGNIALRIRNLESRLIEAGIWKKQRLFSNPVCTNEYPITDDAAALLTKEG